MYRDKTTKSVGHHHLYSLNEITLVHSEAINHCLDLHEEIRKAPLDQRTKRKLFKCLGNVSKQLTKVF